MFKTHLWNHFLIVFCVCFLFQKYIPKQNKNKNNFYTKNIVNFQATIIFCRFIFVLLLFSIDHKWDVKWHFFGWFRFSFSMFGLKSTFFLHWDLFLLFSINSFMMNTPTIRIGFRWMIKELFPGRSLKNWELWINSRERWKSWWNSEKYRK